MNASDARDIDRMARARNGSQSALGCVIAAALCLGCWAGLFAVIGWAIR